MKKIKIMHLTLEQFKGCEHLSIPFNGENAKIYGDNATGKTTVFDGLTWLLFGIDSSGQNSFEIKPLDKQGAVKDHSAITAVEAAFKTEETGEEACFVVLKRTFYEKWSAKRGRAEKTFDGNTSDFFVDGVPVKKFAFEETVSELVNEDMFRILTSTSYFCSGLSWQKRRELLFSLCGVASDIELMELGGDRFSALRDAAGGRSLDDLKRKLLAERKGIAKDRDSIPARMDECKKAVEAVRTVDFSALEAALSEKRMQRDGLNVELLRLSHNTLLDSRKNELDALTNRRQALKQENEAHRTSQQKPSELPEILKRIRALKQDMEAANGELTRVKERAKRANVRIEACRVEWNTKNGKEFLGANCPTCGRPLDGALLEASARTFRTEKELALSALVKEAEALKADLAFFTAEQARLEQRSFALAQALQDEENRKAAVETVNSSPVLDLPDFGPRMEAMDLDVMRLQQEISRLNLDSAGIRATAMERLDTLEQEIRALELECSKRDLLTHGENRRQELLSDAKRLAEKLDQLDRLLFLHKEFVRFKVNVIEERVNSRFRLVKFRLFLTQVNGCIAECCDVTVDGVPYNSLNNGAKLNAGMDVIETLSQFYGVAVPLFVDNAESVTRILSAGTQVIQLYVSESDKKLRCEHEFEN